MSATGPFGGVGRRLAISCCGAALAVSACGDELAARRPTGVSVEKSPDIATLVTVTFGTTEASTAYVEYGPTPSMAYSTPMETDPAVAHADMLLGLQADTTYYYRVVTWDGDDAGASEILTFRTGSLPSKLPALSLEGGGLERYVVVPLQGGAPTVAIIDTDGQIVWYHEDDRGLEIHRAVLSVDGTSVLYDASLLGEDSTPDSEIVRVGLDGEEKESFSVPYLAGDFVERADGTIAAIAMEEPSGSDPRGDRIVEIAPGGDNSTVFTTADCFDPAVDVGDSTGAVWTFANALDYSETADEDVYYVSLENLSSIARVDRQTGSCDWVVGATGGTLDFADGSTPFLHQHQFAAYGDRLLVMDNDANADESRVVEYQLDLTAMTVAETRVLLPDPSVHVDAFGEPTRLPNRDWFVSWGSAGRLELVNEDDESLWRVEAPSDWSFGYHTLTKSNSLYSSASRVPKSEP